MQALLARGHEVVGFDPLFVGESIDPRDPVPHRPEAVHFETYNPAPAAEQMQDLATVLAWCRAQEDVREVSLVCQGTAGYQALIARPVLEGLARTVIELSRWRRRDRVRSPTVAGDDRPAGIGPVRRPQSRRGSLGSGSAVALRESQGARRIMAQGRLRSRRGRPPC